MTTSELPPTSPKWSSTTKLVVGLTVVGILLVALVYFRVIIGPLLLAFILAYVFHPLAARLQRGTNFTWRLSVNLIYLILIILLIGLLTLSGLAIVQQLQSLIRFIQNFTNSIPDLVNQLSNQTYTFGRFQFSLNQFELQPLIDQLLATLQPMLGRVGTLVGTLATSAATTLGWGLFVILVSYFLLAEAGQVSNKLISVDIPGYDADIRRLGSELKNIWNAFLRGQLVIVLLAIFFYTILMTVMGVRYSLGIAILAGLARFVPYVGPAVVWVTLALVTLFQGGNYFGLVPWQFTILVVVLSLLLDQVLDNYVSPRLFGQTLGIHPAAVLVAAIVAASLIGIIGVVLAAPVVATINLVSRYLTRKMFDLEPWPSADEQPHLPEAPWTRAARRGRAWWRILRRKNDA